MKNIAASPFVRRISWLVLTLAVVLASPVGPAYAEVSAGTNTSSGSHCPQQKAPCPSTRSMSCCCDTAPATPISGTPDLARIGFAADLTIGFDDDLAAPVAPRAVFGPSSARFGYHKVPLTLLLSTFLI